MGQFKDRMIDDMEERDNKRLASILGITYDELLELNHTIDSDESKDGLMYSYTISFNPFDPVASRIILDKVRGIDKDNQVTLDPYELSENEYYNEQFDLIITNKDYYDTFNRALLSAAKLNDVELENDDEITSILRRQTYIFVIGALEAFLSEALINLTDENIDYFRNFVETLSEFKEKKFPLSEIFVVQEELKESVKKVLLDINYHNLIKVKEMYQSTFKISFPDIGFLLKSVKVRHDLVHRNGKTKQGEVVKIDKEALSNLIEKTSIFVDEIALKLGLQIKQG